MTFSMWRGWMDLTFARIPSLVYLITEGGHPVMLAGRFPRPPHWYVNDNQRASK